jgi:integrase
MGLSPSSGLFATATFRFGRDRRPETAKEKTAQIEIDLIAKTKVHLLDGLAAELRQWKLECPDPSPDAPMFPNADGGFLDPANFRYRALKHLREALELPKLNFQLLRRTIATRAQKLGSVKNVQSHLRHSRADTTATSTCRSFRRVCSRCRNGLRDAHVDDNRAAVAKVGLYNRRS